MIIPLWLFRVCMIGFILCQYLISYKLRNGSEVVLMIFTIMFTISYAIAELLHVFKKQ
jgi:hypothetical protein